MNIWKSHIHHFHLDHNAPHLLLNILHSHCFQFPLGITVVPREIEDNGYAKFWRVNKVHYGLCENGELVTAVWRSEWKKIVLVIDARLVGELNPWSLLYQCSTLPPGSRTCIWLRINNLTVEPRSMDTHI